MRIISGKFKNRTITTDKMNNFRPTMTKVREAIFSMLSSLPGFTFSEKNILDLYAGSGILGFESLSRGAKHITFIDNTASQLKFIKKNAQILQVMDHITTIECDILKMSADKMKASPCKIFDVIFIDPPYCKIPSKISHKILNQKTPAKIVVSKEEMLEQKNMAAATLYMLLESTWLAKETVIILEVEKNFSDDMLSCFSVIKEKKYSDTKIYILKSYG